MGVGVSAYHAHQDSHFYYLYIIYYMNMYLHSSKLTPISKHASNAYMYAP